MAEIVAVLGSSGTGKSTSLRNLPPNETFIVSVVGKSLPFRGWKKKYPISKDEGKTGGMINTDSYMLIKKVLVNLATRSEIKYIVLDDSQYIMANEFMRRAQENGYGKFTEIAKHMVEVIQSAEKLPFDKKFFLLSHTEEKEGKQKIKTIGNMLDDKITLEGLFSIVLYTHIEDGRYSFLTQNTGQNTGKSPMGMFASETIPNDLMYVSKMMDEYYDGDEESPAKDEWEVLSEMYGITKKQLEGAVSKLPNAKGDLVHPSGDLSTVSDGLAKSIKDNIEKIATKIKSGK